MRLTATPDEQRFAHQFPSATARIESVAVAPIAYFGMDGTLLDQHATAFLYERGSRSYLISALHCFTGRNAFTGQHISKTLYEPRKIRFYPSIDIQGRCTRIHFDLELYDQEGIPLWYEDVNRAIFQTDIGVIDVTDLSPRAPFLHVNNVNDKDEELFVNAGSDCFVVGYPIRAFDNFHVPIWRRGSFATEPKWPIDGRPMFLVDASTSSGMSGSPIFQRSFGPASVHVDGEITPTVFPERAQTTRLIGIYGGRVHNHKDIGPIGYGWYANRLNAIIDQKSLDVL